MRESEEFVSLVYRVSCLCLCTAPPCGCRRGLHVFAPIGPPALLNHSNIFLSAEDLIEGGSLTVQWTVNWSMANGSVKCGYYDL